MLRAMKRPRPDPARIKHAQQAGERARIVARTTAGRCHVEGCTQAIAYERNLDGLRWLTCTEHQFAALPDVG
jgi:hypothetical protein